MNDATDQSDNSSTERGRAAIEPMDPQIMDIQPGGGVVIELEQKWGCVRRWWLKTFRKGYVAKMAACRNGDPTLVPHEVLDPRDLKFYQNQTDCHWDKADDPFAWRDNLPFARVGLAELLVFSALSWGPAIAALAASLTLDVSDAVRYVLWFVAFGLSLCGVEFAWFFRDPKRVVPSEPGLVVAPADGKVVHIEEIEHDDFIGGPAIEIGIFLSIFNVHINRVPVACRVTGIHYKPGLMLNALRPESARENERLTLHLEESTAPHRRMVVRQITGALARRIVCWLKPGDELERGEQLGMIKLGSRTELLLPKEDGLEIVTKLGDNIVAGETIMARYRES
jgi:phosphatidylserine decarboxylase